MNTLRQILESHQFQPQLFHISWEGSKPKIASPSTGTLTPEPTHLWTWNIAEDCHCVQDVLADDEIQRQNAYAFPELRHQFGNSRAVMKIILGHYLDIPAQDISFSLGPAGKPSLLNLPFHFNHSHTRSYATLLVGIAEVGVDIESLGRFNNLDWEPVAREFFHPRESDALKISHNLEDDFMRLWTFKEAWLKARGLGIGELHSVPELDLEDDHCLQDRIQFKPNPDSWITALPRRD